MNSGNSRGREHHQFLLLGRIRVGLSLHPFLGFLHLSLLALLFFLALFERLWSATGHIALLNSDFSRSPGEKRPQNLVRSMTPNRVHGARLKARTCRFLDPLVNAFAGSPPGALDRLMGKQAPANSEASKDIFRVSRREVSGLPARTEADEINAACWPRQIRRTKKNYAVPLKGGGQLWQWIGCTDGRHCGLIKRLCAGLARKNHLGDGALFDNREFECHLPALSLTGRLRIDSKPVSLDCLKNLDEIGAEIDAHGIASECDVRFHLAGRGGKIQTESAAALIDTQIADGLLVALGKCSRQIPDRILHGRIWQQDGCAGAPLRRIRGRGNILQSQFWRLIRHGRRGDLRDLGKRGCLRIGLYLRWIDKDGFGRLDLSHRAGGAAGGRREAAERAGEPASPRARVTAT